MHYLSKKMLASSILASLLLMFIATGTNTAFAVFDPKVYVDPPAILDLDPCNYFNISIKIDNVTSLYGLDVQFSWNPTVVEYVSHTVKIPRNTYPDGVLYNPILPIKNEVNASAGTYWIAYSSMAPAPAFDGNGTIVEFRFHVIALGNFVFDITSSDLANTDGLPITHTVEDGYFGNLPPPPPPQPATIHVDPAKIIDSTLTPCNNFTVDVKITNATDLYSFTFWLAFNTTVLDVSSVQADPSFILDEVTVDEPAGELKTLAHGTPPSPYTGTLASITFHVVGTGESSLDLHDVSLKNATGGDLSFEEPLDGYFNNMLITRMFIDPPELVDPTLKPGDTISFDVKIENAIDMYDYEFKLWYDIDVLICLGAVVVPPNNDTNFTVEMTIDDTVGLLWVRVQYYSPALPITIYSPKTVTQIFFMIQAYGQTVLDLHETEISDPYGNPMPHEVGDGFFATLLRDVSIENVAVTSKNIVYAGRIVTIEVTAMNRGNMTTETFNVTAYFDSNPIETQTVTLGPWTNTTLTFYWNTSGLTPCNNFTISARASPVPYDMDLTNNVFYDGWVKIKLIGDLDGDGDVDIYDMVAAATAYGSAIGDPEYNEEADLASPYGIINLYDIVTIAYHYGESC